MTKQAKSSEESSTDSNSTGDESALHGTQVKMTSSFDPKLEHMLTNYFMAIGDQHDIRQAFIQICITSFNLFTGMCDLEFLRNMQLQKGTDSGNTLNKGKLKLVNDVLLYYNFLYKDKELTKAEDPSQWDISEFKVWKSEGHHVSTAAYNASTTASTANAALNAPAAATAKQKEQDDSFFSWRRSKQDESIYPVLETDRMFTDWSVKFERKIHNEEMYRMIDPAFHLNQLVLSSDTGLFNKQTNHFATILERVLQTSEGKRLTREHADDPRKVWSLHQAHSTSSATSSSIYTGLGQELAKIKIVDYDTPTKGLDTFDSYLTRYNKIVPTNSKMPDNVVVIYLEAATCRISDLLSACTQRKCMKEQMTPRGTTPMYDQYYK